MVLPAHAIDDPRPLVLTTMYWGCHVLLQRASGVLRMHSGRAYPATVAAGMMCSAAAILITQRGTDVTLRAWNSMDRPFLEGGRPSLAADTNWWSAPVWLFFGGRTGAGSSSDRFLVKHAIVSAALHAVLERRAFRTVLPSSLLTVGSYAPNSVLHPFTRGVNATSAVATAAQRAIMQRLGTLHGCHHCGDRQSLRRLPFIADHMPPTKMVLQANSKWYRRLPWLPLPASQKLLPQCQSCFGKQGGAVRAGMHHVVYGTPLRAWHFAPALAYYALENHLLGDAVDGLLDGAIDSAEVASALQALRTWF